MNLLKELWNLRDTVLTFPYGFGPRGAQTSIPCTL